MINPEASPELVEVTEEIIAELVAKGWPEDELRMVIDLLGEDVRYNRDNGHIVTIPVWEPW